MCNIIRFPKINKAQRNKHKHKERAESTWVNWPEAKRNIAKNTTGEKLIVALLGQGPAAEG